MPARFADGPLVLVLAHPGHELRVHGLLARLRPTVLVLTDGSGRTGRPTLSRTLSVLEGAGAQPGPIFGRMTDNAFLEALVAGDHGAFLPLAAEIAAVLETTGATSVAGDAAEGRNPAHDVCRLLVNAAVARRRAVGHALGSYELRFHGPPARGPEGEPGAASLSLDDAELTRKLADARAYEELSADAEDLLSRYGVEAFRTETLFPVRYGFDLTARIGFQPSYEGRGRLAIREDSRAVGTVSYRLHVEPLALALRAEVEEAALAASGEREDAEPLG